MIEDAKKLTELKPCPFCGDTYVNEPGETEWAECWCKALGGRIIYISNWNNRPLEDALSADRDRWKARAEALERAVKGTGMACAYCQHKTKSPIREAPCNTCIPSRCRFPSWEFDEAKCKESGS